MDILRSGDRKPISFDTNQWIANVFEKSRSPQLMVRFNENSRVHFRNRTNWIVLWWFVFYNNIFINIFYQQRQAILSLLLLLIYWTRTNSSSEIAITKSALYLLNGNVAKILIRKKIELFCLLTFFIRWEIFAFPNEHVHM